MMFSKDETPKMWGLGTSEQISVFSPMIVFPVLAILSYYIAVFIEIKISIKYCI